MFQVAAPTRRPFEFLLRALVNIRQNLFWHAFEQLVATQSSPTTPSPEAAEGRPSGGECVREQGSKISCPRPPRHATAALDLPKQRHLRHTPPKHPDPSHTLSTLSAEVDGGGEEFRKKPRRPPTTKLSASFPKAAAGPPRARQGREGGSVRPFGVACPAHARDWVAACLSENLLCWPIGLRRGGLGWNSRTPFGESKILSCSHSELGMRVVASAASPWDASTAAACQSESRGISWLERQPRLVA
jgi:hypothetical protein